MTWSVRLLVEGGGGGGGGREEVGGGGAMSYEPVKYFPEDGIVIFSYSVSYSPFFHFFWLLPVSYF